MPSPHAPPNPRSSSTVNRRPTAPGQAAAFTIIELLVSLAVAAVLLFLINSIFNDTQQAVSKGIALSDIIANTRGASEQFELDARQMVGPQADTDPDEPDPLKKGGFLVITQNALKGVVRRGARGNEYKRPSVSGDRYFNTPKEMDAIRDDQLLFIRERQGGEDEDTLLPITPKNNNTFANDFEDSGDNPYKSRYVKVWYGHVRKTNRNGTQAPPLGDRNNRGPNYLANDWILGRQAMFLVDTSNGASINDIAHANNARYAANVSGYGVPGNVDSKNYAGLSDVAPQRLGSETDTGSIIENLTGGTPLLGYAGRALNYGFIRRRVQANPSPVYDASTNRTYKSWQIAQMHPIFMQHVSDFIVEFAADIDKNGEVDTDRQDVDGDGNDETIIKWYTALPYANDPDFDGDSDPNTPPYDPDKPITYAPSSTGPYPPYFTATAAAGGNLLSALGGTTNAKAAFVWRHDDQNGNRTASDQQQSYWPYMIRIRYRMHDKRGLIESGEDQHGVWFSHVIRVNRPPATNN